MTNDELIARAEGVLNPHITTENRLIGDVGAALVTEQGDVYTGTCVDTTSWGLCAERSAIAAMITARQYRIQKIVAVWKGGKNGSLTVLPPCGVYREFMRAVDGANLDAEIILGRNKTAKLKDLLPYHEWPEPLD